MPKNSVSISKFSSATVFILCVMLLFFAFSATTSADDNERGAAPEVVRYSENFDSVATPQLPGGWTTAVTGAGVNFVTVTDFRDTAPNAAFAPAPAATGLSELTSPPILITSSRTILSERSPR